MEQDSYTPQARNRRAGRQAQVQQEVQTPPQMSVQPMQPVQQAAPQPVMPQQMAAPQPQPYGQQMAYPPAQQAYQQPYRQPQPYQQVQQPYQPQPVQQHYYGQQQVLQPYPQPRQSVQSAPQAQPQVQYAPRVVRSMNGSMQSPLPLPDVPRARQAHGLQRDLARERAQAEQAAPVKPQKVQKVPEAPAVKPIKKGVPKWLSGLLTLMVIVVMALVAAFVLMKAYLTTQENERIAAHNAVLNNYHVTENADGTRSVTWQDVIERYADQYNLEPAFVTAVIRNESSFRTNAESSVGARGLMQMMPATAEWIAGKLDDDRYTFDNMWDGETNIRYGCWYLGYLSELFNGDPVLVACAYHAGQGEVRSWLGDRSISPDGKTVPIDNIPIQESKTYAGRVTQAYGIYQSLLYP